MKKTFEEGHSGVAEFTLLAKDGGHVDGESSAALLQDRSGNPSRFVAVTKDITNRKRAQEAVRESSDGYRSFLNEISDGFVVCDQRGVVILANEALAKMHGYQGPEQLMGRNMSEFIAPEVRSKTIKEREEEIETGNFPEFQEIPSLRKDGGIVFLEFKPSPVIEKGRIVGTKGVMRDVTERKRAEESQIKQAAALARAEELQRSRQRIVAVQESLRRDIARELHGSVQNRLIVLLHRLAELERTAPPGHLAVELRNMQQDLQELLDRHCRPIGRRLYPSILHQGLVPALQSLVDQFEVALAIKVELDQQFVRQERANRGWIPERIRLAAYRIAEEGLTNVLKHAKASEATVRLELLPEGRLRLMVRDNGKGLNPESASGGLGTLMMQDYAEVMGGTCTICGAPGEGTEVAAELPLVGTDL